MYHVVGTSIAVSVLYLISFIFYRIGLFSQARHRKIWNTILAVTFLITALAGLFLALQINYKWDLPVVKSVLKWHVETGAGLAITGVFHLIWHISYFTRLFKRTAEPRKFNSLQKMSSSDIAINLFVIGFTSMSIQILLIREIMNISGGYELTAGTFLASWLIASAIGAAAAGSSSFNDIRKINLVFSISPLISLILFFLLSRLFLQPGETPSFLVSMIFTFLVLIPFCLVSGFTFVKLLAAAKSANDFIPGKSFSIETIGSIAAGLIISVLTAGLFNTYKLILIIILMSITYTILTFYIKDRNKKIVVKLSVTLLAAFILIADPDIFFRQILLPGIKVTETRETPYGNITYAEYGGERSIYYNQRLLTYIDDVAEREENIHYALLQKKNPEKVLLISGSLKSHLPDVLKYPVKKVIFIERDPELIKAETEKADPGNAELIIENKDAFRYIKGKGDKLDAVLLLVPPPSTLSLNRYYTSEFFDDVKKRLVPDGVFMCSPGIWDNYPNKEAITLYSSIYNSLDRVFTYVKPVVGNRLYYIASDNELSASICRLTELRNIENIYVGPYFLSDDLIENKTSEVISLLDKEVRENRAVFPIASFHFQSYFLSKNLNEKIPAIIIMILVFVLPVLSIRRRNLMMYFGAAGLAGFEIIVLLSLQLTAGNMYQITGIILALFMAGLAAGSGINLKFLNRIPLKIKALILVLWYAGIALIINYLLSFTSIPAAISIIMFSVLPPSFLTGHIFRELTLTDSDGSASAKTYGADLAGSAFGFIIVSGVAVPVLGIRISIILLSGLIFAGILLGTNRNK